MEFAAQTIKNVATKTTLAVTAGTLSQPVTFTVTVRAPAAAGSPVGTVNITAHGKVIATAHAFAHDVGHAQVCG